MRLSGKKKPCTETVKSLESGAKCLVWNPSTATY